MLARATSLAGLALITATVVGCVGGSPLERLDERAGLMITRNTEPLVFARTEPRYSRSARDYIYVGPIEINRQGVREYYLWVGVATTLDRGFLAPPSDLPSVLYVEVGGEPMELSLHRWRELVPTTLAEPLYATTVRVREELAARVTLQQLALIDAAAPASIAVVFAGDAPPRSYTRWRGIGGFSAFLDAASGARATR